MSLSTNFSNKLAAIILISLIYLYGLAEAEEDGFQVAVLPFENLSGTAAPLKEMRGAIIKRLKDQGIAVLEDNILEKFMAQYRVRYTGGVDEQTAEAFKKETGISAALITSVELYNEGNPPKVALTSRLVSAEAKPTILWIDGVGLSGDDSPGILGLGLIEDHKKLAEKAVERLSQSLINQITGIRGKSYPEGKSKRFRPKAAYRSPVFDPTGKYTVAVIPFFNESDRKNAGEIMVLHFVRELSGTGNFSVIEPGMVRQQLLKHRIIMDEGISRAQALGIFKGLDADLILSGKVIDYQDPQVPSGKPKVDFSAILMEKKNMEVVWASKSYNEGDESILFFDIGRINTAHTMASEMARNIAKMVSK